MSVVVSLHNQRLILYSAFAPDDVKHLSIAFSCYRKWCGLDSQIQQLFMAQLQSNTWFRDINIYLS